MKELTKEQIDLLCELIDGYAYPRFLTSCDPRVDTEGIWDRSKEFLEIRQVLDPNPNFDIEDEDTYPDFFQHGQSINLVTKFSICLKIIKVNITFVILNS